MVDLHSLSYRMTFKMYAVDFCELLLFDEHKQAYHMVQHAFEKKDALQAFSGYVQQLGLTLTWSSINVGALLHSLCEQFVLSAWAYCTRAEC